MSVPRKNRRKLRLFLLSAAVLVAVLWVWRPWQRPITIVESVNPKDGAAMVWVPAGTFRMGDDGIRDAARRHEWREMRDALLARLRGRATSDESPVHTVYLDGYWIYKYKVTVEQYRKFCRATGRTMPAAPRYSWQDGHPIVNVTWHDAAAYAGWAGASLPTEAQWEKAARGPDGRIYPWGNAWDGTRCCNSVDHSVASTSPVGSFSAGSSPYGAQDMAGNVWEWCADWYDAGYYRYAPRWNTTGPATGTMRLLRGGCWGDISPKRFRVTFRDYYLPMLQYRPVGFRCVYRQPGP